MDLAYGMRDLPVSILGIPVGRLLGLPRVDSDTINCSAYLFYGKHDPVVRNGWQYYNRNSYGINSYMRPVAAVAHAGKPLAARCHGPHYARVVPAL